MNEKAIAVDTARTKQEKLTALQNLEGQDKRPQESEHSIHAIELASYEDINAKDHVDKKHPWVLWGPNNEVPAFLDEMFEECTLHGSLTQSIADMINGQGLVVVNEADQENTLKLNTWLEEKNKGFSGAEKVAASVLDLKKHGNVFITVVWNAEGTEIVSERVMPVGWCAPGKRNKLHEVEQIFVCPDWKDQKKNKPRGYVLFDPQKAKTNPTQIVWIQYKPAVDKYWAKPDYWSGSRSIQLDRETSTFYLNHVLNDFSPTTVMNFANGPIEPKAKRTAFEKDIEEKAKGPKGKKLIITYSRGQDTKVSVETIPVSDADKQYEVIDGISERKTLQAHRVTNPIIFGVKGASGFSNNAEEMETAIEIFESRVCKYYRSQIVDGWTKILKYKGINAKLEMKPYSIDFLVKGKEGQAQQNLSATGKLILTETQQKRALDHFQACGETDQKLLDRGFKLVHTSKVVGDESEVSTAEIVQLAIQSSPDEPSSLDVEKPGEGVWLVRYRYAGPKDDKNRAFCSQMLQKDLLYRKEDIDAMSFRGENKDFKRYSIWNYKGSYGCRHHWQREVYFLDYEDEEKRRVGRVPAVDRETDDKNARTKNPKPRRRGLRAVVLSLLNIKPGK